MPKVLLIILLSIAGFSAGADVITSSSQLQADGSQPVIIKLALPVTSTKQRNSSSATDAVGGGDWLNLQDYIAAAQRDLIEDMGWQNVSKLVAFNTFAAVATEVNAMELDKLLTSDKVDKVFANKFRERKLSGSLSRIGYDAVKSPATAGSGKVVAIVDDGVAGAHEFLSGKLLAEACFSTFFQCNGQLNYVGQGAATPRATDSHGTHIAGIIAGHNRQMHGVAPGARLIAAKVTSHAGGKTGMLDSDVIAALEWVLVQKKQLDIVAVNLSLGGDDEMTGHCDDRTAYTDIFKLLRANNIVPVTASGNEYHTKGLIVPACISYGISVGALTPEHSVAAYSNTAPQLNIMAPGSAIRSSILPAGFAAYDGTSMAAPHVAGALAVLAAAFPKASTEQLLTALQATTVKVLDSRTGRLIPALHLASSINYLAAIFTPVPLKPELPAKPAPEVKPAPAEPVKPGKPEANPKPEKCVERIEGIWVEKAGKDCKPSGKIDW